MLFAEITGSVRLNLKVQPLALLGAPSTTHPRRCWQAQSLSPPSASKCKLSYCYVHRFFVFCICLAVFFLEGPSTVPNLVALLHIDARTALKKMQNNSSGHACRCVVIEACNVEVRRCHNGSAQSQKPHGHAPCTMPHTAILRH